MWGRLYSGFRRGMPIAAIPLRWFSTVTAWLNGMTIEGGHIERTPDGIRIYPYLYSSAWFLVPTSFGIKAVNGTTVTIYGGSVRRLGVESASVTDTDIVLLGGSAESPVRIVLRYKKADGTADITDAATEPEPDDGYYFNRVLWEAYVSNDSAVIVRDRRHDWSIGSVI